nr:tetratricopeptide repeat protein [Legionella jordanis]
MRTLNILLLIFFIQATEAAEPIFCDVTKGLELINQESYLSSQIEMILKSCDRVDPNNPSVLLLHGLLARKKALQDKQQYAIAIDWIKKAQNAAPQNLSISLELAATYQQANELSKAKSLYQNILSQTPNNRAALLGLAFIYRVDQQFKEAATIYQNLLIESPHDVEALNGMGWIKTAERDLSSAKFYFTETLKIQPENTEALIALDKIKQTQLQQSGQAILCDVSKGLILLNQKEPPFPAINEILTRCSLNKIENSDTDLLHGLLARRKAEANKKYDEAISWLNKAMHSAAPDNFNPALELAVTYEWANQFANAQVIYETILKQNPELKAALLGKARVLRLEKNYSASLLIYQQLLSKNTKDIDALNGLGWLKLSEGDYHSAAEFFHTTLSIQPINKEALLALNQIKEAKLQQEKQALTCQAAHGLKLLNQSNPPFQEIEAILSNCEKEKIEYAEVALLRGLLARHKAQSGNSNYEHAIFWLQKAMHLAEDSNMTPALELAVTYEWASQPKKAQLIYDLVLRKEPNNRAALLGEGRVLRRLELLGQASVVYQQLLLKNRKDIEALNGLGWVALAKNDFNSAKKIFQKSISLEPNNQEATLAIKQIKETELHAQLKQSVPPSLCEADKGLVLLNRENPALAEIERLLARCDQYAANNTSTLMLHGLLARYQAKKTQQQEYFRIALDWLERARETAEPGNINPALELATTYEWAGEPKKALIIFQQILNKHPYNRTALLGKARVLRALFQIPQAIGLYQQLLRKSPDDVDALNGLGETFMSNYQLAEARGVLNEALAKNPSNLQTLTDLQTLNQTTRNILGLTQGHYSVPPNTADGVNLFYFRNLNATDALTLYATHNNRQIESNFGAGPTLLPNNSLLLGYQRIIPNRYGWELSYDARQHNARPFEHRVFGSTNWFVLRNLEWFNGLRLVFPMPWTTKLYISGLTLHTNLPVNVSVTGFWSDQKIGGHNSSYSLDFSKEFNKRLFYNVGPSYLVDQQSWEVHGRLILPVFKSQALVAEASHYFFNRSTFIIAGWRIYWA